MTGRRDILKRAAYALGVLPYLALKPQSLFGSLIFPPDAPLVSPQALPANPFIKDGRALVAAVHGHDPGAMLAEGLRVLGGADIVGLRGKRVLIKPNVVNDRPPPSITSPAVVSAVVQWVRAAGAREVIVADSSGMLRFPTQENLDATGIRVAAESAGARVLALEQEDWVRVEPPQATILGSFHVSRPVYEADVVLSVPVVKTHRFAHYSCSLKNWVGIVHPRDRPSLSFLTGQWHERIAELNLAVHPRLTIADATTMMIAGGPTSGTPAQANLLLLSGDRVALDAVAVALIRTYGAWPKVMEGTVWSQRQIRRATALGLGVSGPAQVELVTATVDGPSDEFQERMRRVRDEMRRT